MCVQKLDGMLTPNARSDFADLKSVPQFRMVVWLLVFELCVRKMVDVS